MDYLPLFDLIGTMKCEIITFICAITFKSTGKSWKSQLN